MPTIVWLMAAAGAWLAAVSAACMLLRVAKRADADADAAAGGDARGPRWRGLPENDAPGLVEPRISAIARGVREPRLARATSAIAPGGPRPRRLRSAPRGGDGDQSRARHNHAPHRGEAIVARLRWRTDPGEPGWDLWQPRAGWRRLAIDADLDAGGAVTARRPGWREAAELAACLGTALALDAAANLLHGPPAVPPRQ